MLFRSEYEKKRLVKKLEEYDAAMESLMKDSRMEKKLEDVLERHCKNVLNLKGEGIADDVISMDLLDALVKKIVVYSPERVKVTFAFSDELEEWTRKLQTDAPREREWKS